MSERGDIIVQPQLRYHPLLNREMTQQRVVALRDPDMSLFSSEEIALVDSVIDAWADSTGTEMSEVTHGYRGWLVARELRDTIPYPAVFLSDEGLTDADLLHASELVERYEWSV
jgi:hypothetical protein